MKIITLVISLLFSLQLFSNDILVVDKSKYTKFKFEGLKSGKRPHLQFGGDLGLNLNYFVYKSNKKVDYKVAGVGYQGGFFFRVSKGNLYTQIDFNFLRQNFKIGTDVIEDDSLYSVTDTKFRINSVGIPIVLGVYAYKNPFFKLRFFTGIEPYFLVKSKIIIDYFENGVTSREVYKFSANDLKDDFRRFQLSYQLGTGFDLGMFNIDLRYSIGIINFLPDKNTRNQTHLLQLIAGVNF